MPFLDAALRARSVVVESTRLMEDIHLLEDEVQYVTCTLGLSLRTCRSTELCAEFASRWDGSRHRVYHQHCSPAQSQAGKRDRQPGRDR